MRPPPGAQTRVPGTLGNLSTVSIRPRKGRVSSWCLGAESVPIFDLILLNFSGRESGFHRWEGHTDVALSSPAVTLTGPLIPFLFLSFRTRKDSERDITVRGQRFSGLAVPPPALSLLHLVTGITFLLKRFCG